MKLFILLIFTLFSFPVFAQDGVSKAFGDIEKYFKDLNGVVADVDNSKVFIDIGSDKNAVRGLKLLIHQEGEEIIHPISGQVLGRRQGSSGVLTITHVEPQFSEAVYTGTIPAKGNRVGLLLPVEVNIVLDNVTDVEKELVRSILSANTTLKKNTDGAYTITLKRTENLITYEVFQKHGEVITFSGSVNIQPTGAAHLEAIGSGSLPAGRYISVAMGRFIPDSNKLYMVAARTDRVHIFDPTDNYKRVAEISGVFGQILNIEAADLDESGTDSLFISNVIKARDTQSMIYKHDGEKFVRVQANIGYLFRSVRQGSDVRRIIAQKISREGEYTGEIFYMVYADGEYDVSDVAIRGSLGKRLLGFSMLYPENGDAFMLNIGRGNRLTISTFRQTEYTAADHFGDTFNQLEFTSTTKGRVASPDSEEVIRRVERLLYVNPRIENIDNRNFAVVRNNLVSRVFVNSPVFSRSDIGVYQFQHGVMRTVAEAKDLPSVIVDIWVYGEDGVNYIVALTAGNSRLFTNNSRVTVFRY